MRVESNSDESNQDPDLSGTENQAAHDIGQHVIHGNTVVNEAISDHHSKLHTNQGTQRFPGQRGRQKRPTKVLVTMRFSREVLDYFKSSGEGWQTRMNDVLKQHVAQQEIVKG